MDEIKPKINIYDQLAYIMVGMYQIAVAGLLYFLIYGGDVSDAFAVLKIEFTVALILCAYLVGHLVQAVSNIFEKWEKKKKDEKQKDLSFVTDKAREFFQLPEGLSEKYVWQYCYLYALSNDFSGHVALFNSLHSLYRGFWVASNIGLIVSSVMFVTQLAVAIFYKFTIWPEWKFGIFAIVFFLLSRLFRKRRERFFTYMSEKTLITYDILSKGNFNNKDNK
jgi:membrane protein implicated in regulation of membrane protease activity